MLHPVGILFPHDNTDVRKEKNCVKYTENIKCHSTKFCCPKFVHSQLVL